MIVLGPFSALSWHFRVRCDTSHLADQIDRVFSSLAASPDVSAVDYELRGASETAGTLRVADQDLGASHDEWVLYARLLWHVNAMATKVTTDHVLLHAASAEVDGRAVILSAPSDSGKTTLVSGLVLSGMRYLTDEAVAVRPSDGGITPFPKALSVDHGSWPVLRQLRPEVPAVARHLVNKQWQVPPQQIRSDAVSSGGAPTVVVLPRYQRSGTTTMRAITPGLALTGLLKETFHLTRQPERDLKVLSRVVEHCDCYELSVTDLAAAVKLVRQALDAATRNVH